MSENRSGGLFRAAFTYTDAVLSDFEAMYRQKKEISPAMRIVLGALGAVGAVYFGWMLYRDGLSLTRVGYVLICDFVYSADQYGNRRGWGVAAYSTPEKFMGAAFAEKVYDRSPEESHARLLEHLHELLPDASDKELRRFLK